MARFTVFVTVVVTALAVIVFSHAKSSDRVLEAFPTAGAILAQDFDVSVITSSYGVFNATLRIRSFPNFPERLSGELVPKGEAVLSLAGQTALPHFDRERELMDDKLSSFALYPAIKEKSEAIVQVDRPTLFVIDIHLQHADTLRGKASIYYLPADRDGLHNVREAMETGTSEHVARTSFELRQERPVMTGTPLSDVPTLARTGSTKVQLSGSSEQEGSLSVRFLTEHEFTLHLTLPSKMGRSMERVWVHGYTAPNKEVYDRKEKVKPRWYFGSMVGLGLLTFAIQVLSGYADSSAKLAANRPTGAAITQEASKKK